MSKSKMEKFAAIGTFRNVLQNWSHAQPAAMNKDGEAVAIKGKWGELMFGNNQPIILELACGKGEYTNAMAAAYPDKNFIGIDIKGNRLHNGAAQALEKGHTNAAFLRTEIFYLPHFFAPGEVQEIWITFPDPHLRPSKSQQRLTSERFIDIYRQSCAQDAIVHLKTDDPTLYEFTLEAVEASGARLLYQSNDIYAGPLQHPLLEVKTYYERMHLEIGRKIKYVSFQL
jgi:tRNA (guanine-N7-)-methyltransferase